MPNCSVCLCMCVCACVCVCVCVCVWVGGWVGVCRGEGGQITNFWEKPSCSFNYYKRIT